MKNNMALLVGVIVLLSGLQLQASDSLNAYYFAVKGGISLGSYETGLNRTLLRYAQQQGDEVVAFSGASAGSINSVLSAIDICIQDKRVTQDDIALTDSLNQNFMRWSWDIGIKDLVPSREQESRQKMDNSQRGIFNRVGFDNKKQLIKKLIQRDGVKGCNIIITMSITKVEPYQYRINELGATVKLQRFVIPLQVMVDDSKKLVFKNYEALHQPLEAQSIEFPTPYLKLVENNQGLVDFDDVWNLALASSAFPMAFSPVAISYCHPLELKGKSCTRGRARTEKFSDGGFFDNSPIGVSLDVYDNKIKLNPLEKKPVRLIYINPDSYRVGDKLIEKQVDQYSVTGLYDYGTYFINSFSTALDNEYRTSLKRLSKIDLDNRNFYMSNRFHHLLADLHEHFGAFYAAEYRMHDYLVGVYDGQHLIAQIECDTSSSSIRQGKNINRFGEAYKTCVREEMLQWVKSLNNGCPVEEGVQLSHEDSDIDFFRYLFNTEFEKSLTICQKNKNLNIALSKSFGTVRISGKADINYSNYLDRLDSYVPELDLATGSDLDYILKDGRKFTANKLSQIYENVIEIQQAAADCKTCPGRIGNRYLGTALKVAQPIVDSFLSHHDSQIWPLPIKDILSVKYGVNLNQKNHVLGLDVRPKALSFGNLSIDMSLAYQDYGRELANDDYLSLSVGLTHHNDSNGFLLATWGVGYQYETKGDHVYDHDLNSVYLKAGLLNELLSLQYLHRLDDIERYSVITRKSTAVVMTLDVSKLCQMVLPGWCGR